MMVHAGRLVRAAYDSSRQHNRFLMTCLNHVFADCSDLLQVAAHLVVEQCEPVGDPELKDAARLCQLVDENRFVHACEYPGSKKKLLRKGRQWQRKLRCMRLPVVPSICTAFGLRRVP